jgi:hypothetical protein
MATRSPGLKSLDSVIVLWTSVSNTLKKHSLHICCPVFGRLKIAFAFWQSAQLFGAIVVRPEGDHGKEDIILAECRSGDLSQLRCRRTSGKEGKGTKSLKSTLSRPRKSLSRQRAAHRVDHHGSYPVRPTLIKIKSILMHHLALSTQK